MRDRPAQRLAAVFLPRFYSRMRVLVVLSVISLLEQLQSYLLPTILRGFKLVLTVLQRYDTIKELEIASRGAVS